MVNPGSRSLKIRPFAPPPLQEGAIPVRQKPFSMHEEKAEAHRKLVQEGVDNGYLELAEVHTNTNRWVDRRLERTRVGAKPRHTMRKRMVYQYTTFIVLGMS